MNNQCQITKLPANCIMLSSVVLNEPKLMSAADLKVYIVLCARFSGRPVSASIREIEKATALKRRSIIGAIKVLAEKNLITRISIRGNQPNQYSILLPKETVASPGHDTAPSSQELRQVTTPVATPTRVITPEHIIAPLSAESGQPTAPSPTPTQAPIRVLVDICYRPINDQELAELTQAYAGEVVLREKLVRLEQSGRSVARNMPIDHFIRVLDKYYS